MCSATRCHFPLSWQEAAEDSVQSYVRAMQEMKRGRLVAALWSLEASKILKDPQSQQIALQVTGN